MFEPAGACAVGGECRQRDPAARKLRGHAQKNQVIKTDGDCRPGVAHCGLPATQCTAVVAWLPFFLPMMPAATARRRWPGGVMLEKKPMMRFLSPGMTCSLPAIMP
ncbi:MAG: hypothetical protein ACK5QG_07145, partial [Bacteroidota bacterium]